MKIVGVGTDIVQVSRMESGLARFGAAYASRMLSPGEQQAFQQSQRPAAFLAKRFAAKEALVKALGTGFRDGIGLRQIAVRLDGLGKPELVCEGRAAERMTAIGAVGSHLSLADEREYAVAFVLLVGDGGGR